MSDYAVVLTSGTGRPCHLRSLCSWGRGQVEGEEGRCRSWVRGEGVGVGVGYVMSPSPTANPPLDGKQVTTLVWCLRGEAIL